MGGVYRRSLAPELSIEKRGLGASAVRCVRGAIPRFSTSDCFQIDPMETIR